MGYVGFEFDSEIEYIGEKGLEYRQTGVAWNVLIAQVVDDFVVEELDLTQKEIDKFQDLQLATVIVKIDCPGYNSFHFK